MDVRPEDVAEIRNSLARIARAVEALAKAADPKFKTLVEEARTATGPVTPRR